MRLRRVRNCGVKSCKAIGAELQFVVILITPFSGLAFRQQLPHRVPRSAASSWPQSPEHHGSRWFCRIANCRAWPFHGRKSAVVTTSVTGRPSNRRWPLDSWSRKPSHQSHCRGSRPASGLSTSSTSGLSASARARPARFCQLRPSVPGVLSAHGVELQCTPAVRRLRCRLAPGSGSGDSARAARRSPRR